MNERARWLLEIADDELVLGWRDSEWTGIAPLLEEDVALSSIAQNEIGHARAIYALAGLATTPTRSRSTGARRVPLAPLVELRFVPDWARTIARRTSTRRPTRCGIARLEASDDEAVAGLAAKIDREEAYHRMHARDVGRAPARRAALRAASRSCCRTRSASSSRAAAALARRLGLAGAEAVERGRTRRVAALWEEMTMVRRSRAGGALVTDRRRSGRRSTRSPTRRSRSISLVDLGVVRDVLVEDGRVQSSSRRRSSAAPRSR